MADRPINLYQHEVRAVRAGRQTQVRRALKPQPHIDDMGNLCIGDNCYGQTMRGEPCLWNPAFAKHVKLAAPGDRLWARETHYVWDAGNVDGSGLRIDYRATEPDAPCTWTPSTRMPRWASRITLLVDEVRVQRLQEISDEDAVAEGIEPVETAHGQAWRSYETYPDGTPHPHAIAPNRAAVTSFRELWNSINGPGAWEANPWVEVRMFRTVLANIDEGAR